MQGCTTTMGQEKTREAWENWVTNEDSTQLSLSHKGHWKNRDNASAQRLLGEIKGWECPDIQTL